MAIPPDLRLDHSGGHYCKHPSPLVDQIARTALVVDAASCHGLDYCFPPVARLLEICPEPLLQRELVTQPPWLSRQPGILPAKPQCRQAPRRNRHTCLHYEISACAIWEMFLIKRPLLECIRLTPDRMLTIAISR